MSDPVSQIFDRYLDQPPTLPTEVRRRVERACQGEIIQLYALADLDASLPDLGDAYRELSGRHPSRRPPCR